MNVKIESTKELLKPFQSLDLYTTLNNDLTISFNKLEQNIMDIPTRRGHSGTPS